MTAFFLWAFSIYSAFPLTECREQTLTQKNKQIFVISSPLRAICVLYAVFALVCKRKISWDLLSFVDVVGCCGFLDDLLLLSSLAFGFICRNVTRSPHQCMWWWCVIFMGKCATICFVWFGLRVNSPKQLSQVQPKLLYSHALNLVDMFRVILGVCVCVFLHAHRSSFDGFHLDSQYTTQF